jgi:MoaA/NifB/PqqE/SkfB family radical SAM enzyme
MVYKRLLLCIGYSCNNNCIFCSAESYKKRDFNKSTQEVTEELANAKERGMQEVEFIGGEPTLRKDFVGLVGLAKTLGYERIILTTNGRLFSYQKFVDRVINAGLNEITFSIYGSNSRLHNSLTRTPSSFEQLIKGIKNVVKHGSRVKIAANIVIVKSNVKDLPNIVGLVKTLGLREIFLSFAGPEGKIYHNPFIIPQLNDIKPYFKQVIDDFRSNMDIIIMHLPYCFLEGYDGYFMPSEDHTFLTTPEKEDSGLRSKLSDLKIKFGFCKRCKFDSLCGGIWKDYVRLYGDKEFRSIQ